MKYYKVVAFFGHQPITSLCIKSDKCMSALRSSLEFHFLKTPWVFLIAPIGRKQSLFINEYESIQDVADYLVECIKITQDIPKLEIKNSFEETSNIDRIRILKCEK